MDKLDIWKIRGLWMERDTLTGVVGGGDDTVKSIRMVAEKVNEIIDWINSK